MPDEGPAPDPTHLWILLVDDDALVREATAWMLSDAGHTVIEAADAAEAMDRIEHEGDIDLMITDINMPGMDGAELARQVGTRWPHLPVLLVSGRPQPAGSAPFMPKPYGWDTLMNAVANVVEAPGASRLQPTAPTSNRPPP